MLRFNSKGEEVDYVSKNVESASSDLFPVILTGCPLDSIALYTTTTPPLGGFYFALKYGASHGSTFMISSRMLTANSAISHWAPLPGRLFA